MKTRENRAPPGRIRLEAIRAEPRLTNELANRIVSCDASPLEKLLDLIGLWRRICCEDENVAATLELEDRDDLRNTAQERRDTRKAEVALVKPARESLAKEWLHAGALETSRVPVLFEHFAQGGLELGERRWRAALRITGACPSRITTQPLRGVRLRGVG